MAQAQPTRGFDFSGGTNAVADNVDTDLNTLYTVLQGGIGDTHIASDAQINHGKILGGVRISDRQNIAVNSTVTDLRECMGWNFVTGTGSGAAITKAISFPFTFTNVPIVFVTQLGDKTTSDPTAIGDFTVGNQDIVVAGKAGDITTTGFNCRVTGSSNFTNGLRIGFAWRAIETKAN